MSDEHDDPTGRGDTKLKIRCPNCEHNIEMDLIDMAKTYQVLADVMWKQIKEMTTALEAARATTADYRQALLSERKLNPCNPGDDMLE